MFRQSEGSREPASFHSYPSTVFTIKIWAPLLIAAGIALFERDSHGWRACLAFPAIGLLFFFVTLAVLELDLRGVRYKRFFTWVAIEQSEIDRCGAIWPPFVGYVKLKHFVFPWGRIYFVLDRNVARGPFWRSDFGLLRALNDLRHRSLERR